MKKEQAEKLRDPALYYDERPFSGINTLQHTAAHWTTLQYTATYCNTLEHTATHCNTLQHAFLTKGSCSLYPWPAIHRYAFLS